MTTRIKLCDRRGRPALGALLSVLVAVGWASDGSAEPNHNWPHATYFTVVVRPGDTFSRLGARYGLSAGAVARLNDLEAGSELRAGEVLRVPATGRATREAVLLEALDRETHNYAPPPKPVAGVHTVAPARGAVSVHDLTPIEFATGPSEDNQPPGVNEQARSPHGPLHFGWPVIGPVILPFGTDGAGERNDGINIAAEMGAPILAAAAGTVTYAGNELKGYGNLILITHHDSYVTAYAHAQSIAVNRGEHVEKGQVIGTAGATGGVDRPQLHFEIRHGVHPVNPRLLLANR
jgi:murein DD-endopeptidase MepM/ murein hydrolase activator NlpD